MSGYLAPFPVGDFDIEDLFAGPGGWDAAALMLGLRVRGFEKDDAACLTRTAAGLETVKGDLSRLDPRDYPSRIQLGSPPCQGFSMAGKGKGRADSVALLTAIKDVTTLADLEAAIENLHEVMTDDRTLLVLEPLRWALTNLPEVLAWEQVPAVLPIWEVCAEILERNGYSTAVGKLTSEQYGVPQTRVRAILVARSAAWTAKRGPVALPTPTHSKYHNRTPSKVDAGVPRWVSMAEALGWRVAPGELVVTGSMGKPKTHHEDGTRAGGDHTYDPALRPSYTMTGISQGNVAPADQPVSLVPANGRVRTDGGGAWPRSEDKPAPTVTGEIGGQWEWQENGPDGPTHLRNGKQANATVREVDQPASTIMAAMDNGDTRWVQRSNYSGSGTVPGATAEERGRTLRDEDQPSLTVTSKGFQWQPEQGEPRSSEQVIEAVNNQSGSAYDLQEQSEGPATALAGREVVGFRGANANRFNGSTKSRNDGWRVTPEEAAALQTFPTGWPWQGNKSQVFQQIGNAIPSLLAAHVIAAAVGIPFAGWSVIPVGDDAPFR